MFPEPPSVVLEDLQLSLPRPSAVQGAAERRASGRVVMLILLGLLKRPESQLDVGQPLDQRLDSRSTLSSIM
jgi:hypothetical protein